MSETGKTVWLINILIFSFGYVLVFNTNVQFFRLESHGEFDVLTMSFYVLVFHTNAQFFRLESHGEFDVLTMSFYVTSASQRRAIYTEG